MLKMKKSNFRWQDGVYFEIHFKGTMGNMGDRHFFE